MIDRANPPVIRDFNTSFDGGTGYITLNATAGDWTTNTVTNPEAGSFIGDGNYSHTYDDDSDWLYCSGPDCEAFYQYLNFSYSVTEHTGAPYALNMTLRFEYEDNTDSPFSNASLLAYNFTGASWDVLSGSTNTTFPGADTDYTLESTSMGSDYVDSQGVVMTCYNVWYNNSGQKGLFDVIIDRAKLFLLDIDEPTVIWSFVNPDEPYDDENVTLAAVATDTKDVLTLKFNAIVYPNGFSDVDYSATEASDDLWTYTFTSMVAGFYCFKVNASDGLNSNEATEHAYISLTVRERTIAFENQLYLELENLIEYSADVNQDVDYYAYENETLIQSGSKSQGAFAITWTRNTTVGTISWGIYFNTSTDSVWVNGSYYNSPSVEDDFSLTTWDIDWQDVYVHVTWATSWGNSTITPHDDGSPASGTTENYTLKHEMLSTIGDHTLDFKIDAGGDNILWKNYSYTVSATALTYDTAILYTYNQAGDYVDWENFVFYVNETQIPANTFYNRTDYVYNITITDIFGDTLYSQVLDFERAIRITLAIHSFQLVSELLEPIWVRLTSSGGGYKEVWLYRGVPYEWWLYESKSYQWYWNIAGPGMGQVQGPHYYPGDGSWYTPVSAIMYKMSGYGMGELKDDIPDSTGGGGGLTQSDRDDIAETVVEDVVSLLNPLEGGPVGILIVCAFSALAYMSYTIPRRVVAKTYARPKPPEEEEEEEDKSKTKPRVRPKQYKSRDRARSMR
jgi:hypothetical protein